MQVNGWLQEKNLLSAVPEERQQIKSATPLASENPYWSNNALNSYLLCRKPANLQMQIDKKLNVMSFGVEFINIFFESLGFTQAQLTEFIKI